MQFSSPVAGDIWPRPWRAVCGRLDAVQVGLFVVLAIFAAVLIVLPPAGEFSVDDDWVYAQAVQRFAADGQYHPSIWIDTSFMAQATWGAAIARVFGFSFTNLRWSTLAFAAAALVLYYLLLSRILAPRQAVLVTLLLLFQPLVLHLSYTFMTDIPFLALALGALWCVSVGLEDRRAPRYGWLVAGSTCLGLACLVRQLGIVLLPVLIVAALPELRARRGALAPTLTALLLPAAASLLLLAAVRPPEVTVETRGLDLLLTAPASQTLGAVPRGATGAALLLGLAALPMAPPLLRAVWAAPPAPRQRWLAVGALLLLGGLCIYRGGQALLGLAPALLAATVAASALPIWHGRLRLRRLVLLLALAAVCAAAVGAASLAGTALSPLYGNTLSPAGLTTSGLHPRSSALEGTVLVALSAGALVGALALALAVGQVRQPRLPLAPRLLLLATLTTLAATLGYLTAGGSPNGLYDRYLVPILPGALALGALAIRERRAATLCLALGVLAFAGWSLAWQQDYWQRQAAVWDTARALTVQGIPPDEISAGFEWNGWHGGDAAIQRARDEVLRSGEPRHFVQLAIDGIYRPRRWQIDFQPAPQRCPGAASIETSYGAGWTVYARERCGPPRPPREAPRGE